MTSRYELHQGDALTVLRSMASESVHMCMCSPPYWGLRDYQTGIWEGGSAECDHKARPSGGPNPARYSPGGGEMFRAANDKAYADTCGKCGARRIDQGIGLEQSPSEWCAKLVEVFREVRRVLRRDGTLWLNLGFSYDGKGNLIDQPTMLRDALVADGWYCKAPIVWSKPNCMPSSQDARPTVAHEMVWLLARDNGTRYFFDSDAVREPHIEPWRSTGRLENRGYVDVPNGVNNALSGVAPRQYNPNGRSIRSVWTIPTEASPLPHFATYPQALVKPCVLAGTSQRGVCPACGSPWVRVVEKKRRPRGDAFGVKADMNGHDHGQAGSAYQEVVASRTVGWRPSCSCPPAEPVSAVVLDPFCGTGTTGLVALRYGRRFVGVELSPEYVALARARLEDAAAQPLLQFDDPAPAQPGQLALMEDPGNGAQETTGTRLPERA